MAEAIYDPPSMWESRTNTLKWKHRKQSQKKERKALYRTPQPKNKEVLIEDKRKHIRKKKKLKCKTCTNYGIPENIQTDDSLYKISRLVISKNIIVGKCDCIFGTIYSNSPRPFFV